MTAVRAIWLVLATSVRVSPWQSLLCLSGPAGVVLSVLQPVSFAWLVTGAIDHELDQIAVAAALLVASAAGSEVLGLVGINARIGQLERVANAFDTRIATITGRIPTLDHVEAPRYLDQLQTLNEEQGNLGVGLNILLNCIVDLVRVGLTLAVAAAADWRLLLVAAAGVPSLLAARWYVGWQAEAESAAAQPGRLATHLLDLGLTAAPGAELRVFGLAEDMRARLRRAVVAWRAPFALNARRAAILETACGLFFFAIAGGVLAWMLDDVIGGTVGLGALLLAVLLVNRLQTASTDLQESIRKISRVIRAGTRFLWLLDYEKSIAAEHSGSAQPRLRNGIRLEHLSYRYPDSEQPALHDVSLDLPAGSIVALVGDNGAGKSTLVKLLAGLYRPTCGRITLDDVDLSDVDLVAWRQRISGAFQDYATVEVAAGETVGIGDLARIDDAARIEEALRAGAATEVVDALPRGLATQLGTVWHGGVGLSGGQWQRLALARGMMRQAPLLLVLDEPTAALDALTEHALFERYARAAQRATITLLVTHRFSTAASADLIVVLDNGRIIEKGTHAALLAAGGQYADLYHLQARGYR